MMSLKIHMKSLASFRRPEVGALRNFGFKNSCKGQAHCSGGLGFGSSGMYWQAVAAGK